MHIKKRKGVGYSTGQERAVLAPLISQRTCPGCPDDIAGIAPALYTLGEQRNSDDWRLIQGQTCHTASGGAVYVGYDQRVIAAVGGRNGRERECITGRAGHVPAVVQISPVLPPLISQRQGAGSSSGKDGIAA